MKNIFDTDSSWQGSPSYVEEKYYYSKSLEKSLFTKVFAWMGGALFLTAITALLVASSSLVWKLVATPALFFGLVIAELIVVVVLSARIYKMSFATASLLMVLYSILNGTTLSLIFMAYSLGSIAKVFFITAAMFIVMAIIGAVTKRNLAPMSRYLIMILVGIIIMSVVNIFLGSSKMDWIISAIGVLLFTLLTAVDTNKIKNGLTLMSENGADTESLHKMALIGSLQLYLDFVNLFLYLLRFLGRRN